MCCFRQPAQFCRSRPNVPLDYRYFPLHTLQRLQSAMPRPLETLGRDRFFLPAFVLLAFDLSFPLVYSLLSIPIQAGEEVAS